MNALEVIAMLRKRQDAKLQQYNKLPEGKPRVRKKLDSELKALGATQNMLWHILEELKRLGVEKATINKEGLCYGCGNAIEDGIVVIYQSAANGSISLFHKDCWTRTDNVAGGRPPLCEVTLKPL